MMCSYTLIVCACMHAKLPCSNRVASVDQESQIYLYALVGIIEDRSSRSWAWLSVYWNFYRENIVYPR